MSDIRTDIHCHYCERCEGYSACYSDQYYNRKGICLLTERCVSCGDVLEGVPPRGVLV